MYILLVISSVAAIKRLGDVLARGQGGNDVLCLEEPFTLRQGQNISPVSGIIAHGTAVSPKPLSLLTHKLSPFSSFS